MSLSILGEHVADSRAESAFQVIFSHGWAEPWSMLTTWAGWSGSAFSSQSGCRSAQTRPAGLSPGWGAVLTVPGGFASLLQSGQVPTPCPGGAAKGSGSSHPEDLS